MSIIRCERCGKKINPKTLVWLELGIENGKYYKPEEFPNNIQSQGLFTFGKDCAIQELKETKKFQ